VVGATDGTAEGLAVGTGDGLAAVMGLAGTMVGAGVGVAAGPEAQPAAIATTTTLAAMVRIRWNGCGSRMRISCCGPPWSKAAEG
jgi:hypothetical protein